MEFRVLGPVELWVGGQACDLGPPQQRHVFAALAVDAGRAVSTDTLVDRIWDVAPVGASRVIQVHISRIRKLLAQVSDGGGPAVGVVRRSGGYLLDVDPDQVDLRRFRRLSRLVVTQGGDDPPLVLLREARELWRGEPLAGLRGPWVVRSRQAWWQQFLDVTVAWAQAEILAGTPEAVIGPVGDLAASHPLAESLAAVLLRALAAAGRPAEALAHYAVVRRRLTEELGVNPSVELQSVYQAILHGDPGLSHLRPASPAPTMALSVPAQLPADVTGFVGRDEYLARLDAVLSDAGGPAAVVVSALSGTAGVGKTALAVHWAHRVAGQFPDGQLYVNLRGFDPGGMLCPADAVRGFLDALRVDPQRIPATLDAQAALYRSLLTGKRILIVLDNVRDSDQVRHLLPGAPGCMVVVTSRNRLTGLLALNAAYPVTLDLLSTREAKELLAHRLGAARVAAEPRATEEIIAACARLPLALAIAAAAAQQSGFALAALAADLRDVGYRLDTLDAGDPSSQVRAVFSWSMATLTPPAARLFRLLSLNPGSDISAPAAASLADSSVVDTRRLLTELVRATLLNEHVSGRFTCHDLLRAYATEQTRIVDSDQLRNAAVTRLLDHYLHTAYVAERLLYPAWDPIVISPAHPGVTPERLANHHQAMDWFTAEHSQLLAAIEYCAANNFHAHTWQLAWAVRTFLSRRGHWRDQVSVGRAAVMAAGRLADPLLRAHAHRNLAFAFIQLRCFDEAQVQVQEALGLSLRIGDQVEQGHAHNTMALALGRQARPALAMEQAQRAHHLFQSAGHQIGQATALNGAAWYHIQLGDLQEALTACQRSRALYQEAGDRTGEAIAEHIIGGVHYNLRHYIEAISCYERSLALFRDLGDRYYEAKILKWLGEIHQTIGNSAAAQQAWHQALTILRELEHPDAAGVHASLILSASQSR